MYIILKRIKQLHGSKLNSATNHLLPLWVDFPPCPPFCHSFERTPPRYSWHTLAWFQRTQNHQQPEMKFKKIHVKQESAQPYKVISDQCTVCITKEKCNQYIKKYKYYKGFLKTRWFPHLICIFHISFLSFDYYLDNPIKCYLWL